MKLTSSLKPSAIILAVLLLLTMPVLGVSAGPQELGEGSAWIVWETDSPIQRLAWDGEALWTGHYRAGLAQWALDVGQVAGYTTADGLSGEHVTGIAVDTSGQKWLSIYDGSLNNTLDGNAFNNLTPAGIAGKNAWAVATYGSEVWLGSLGGGVSRFSAGNWTTYNTSNSALPHNDIYAVALEGNGTAWVGTVNYGVAALQGGTWVPYTLPVQVANPLSPGTFLSNQAVTDIAIDSAGNKWFATDGSGVAMLDASNSVWTIYDTSNSGLSSNFIQSIHIDSLGYLWFGTLGGGFSGLLPGDTWLTYNSNNSPLPEDDILDVVTDSQGGLWLAAYDSGLTYYGPLPATPPTIELDLLDKPFYLPGKAKGYYLWVDSETFEYTLAWSGDGSSRSFNGEILADSSLEILSTAGLEPGDSVVVDQNTLSINATESSGEDAVTFKLALDATQLTIRLKIDGAYYPYSIHLGGQAENPGTAPFRVAAVQPQPPQVEVPEDLTVDEGETVFLSGQLSDPDSPLGHRIVWNLSDNTLIEGQLSVTHVYKDDGFYTAQLTVTDVNDRIGTNYLNITVLNVAPQADFFHFPITPNVFEVITFNGNFFDPGEADTHTITWDFGDGSGPLVTPELETTHAYQAAGLYDVTMTVTDDDGGVGVSRTTIEVINEPPVLTHEEAATVDEGAPLSQTVSFVDTDSIQWGVVVDYGDGSPLESFTMDTVAEFSLDGIYADNGQYTLTLTITDDGGVSATGEILVTVDNVAPLLVHPEELTVVEGLALTDTFSIEDPGDDTWTVTLDYGDGSTSEVLQLTTRDIPIEHTYADNGSHTLTIDVVDDDGGLGAGSIAIEVTNAEPVVGIDGDDLNISEGDAVSVQATFSDTGILDTHTGVIVWGDGDEEVLNLQITGAGTGSLSAQHTYGDNGDFNIEICITDNNDAEGCGPIQVVSANLAPAFEAGPDLAVPEGTEIDLSSSEFSDAGFLDTHLVTIEWGDGSREPGTVEYTAAGLGFVSGTHSYGDEGQYSVAIEFCDDDGACVGDGFEVVTSNVDPAAYFDNKTFKEGASTAVSAGFSDPGFLDTHTATIDWGDTSPLEAVTVAETDGSGTIQASHLYTDNGSYNVVLTVLDDDAGEGIANGIITVDNVAPTGTFQAPSAVNEGTDITLALKDAFDPSVIDTAVGFEYAYDCGLDLGYGVFTSAATADCISNGLAGTRTVGVIIRDKDGGTTEYTAEVSVKSVREIVQGVRDELANLIPTGDEKLDKDIEKALKHLDKGLEEKLWHPDGSRLTGKGKKVFDELKHTLKDLDKLKTPPAAISTSIELLSKVSGTLAQTVIYDAISAGAKGKDIDKATKELDKGDKELGNEKFDKAVDRYKKAWKTAWKALSKVLPITTYPEHPLCTISGLNTVLTEAYIQAEISTEALYQSLAGELVKAQAELEKGHAQKAAEHLWHFVEKINQNIDVLIDLTAAGALKDDAYCLLGWLGVDEISLRDLESLRLLTEDAFDQGLIDNDQVRYDLVDELEKAQKELRLRDSDKASDHLGHFIEHLKAASDEHISAEITVLLQESVDAISDMVGALE